MLPVMLTGRPMRQLRVFGPGLLFVLFILWVEGWTERGVLTWLGYFCLAISLLIIAGIAVSLFRAPRLTLDDHGLTWQAALGVVRFPWKEVSDIRIVSATRLQPPKIGFTFHAGSLSSKQAGRPFNRRIVGYDWSVQNVWDCSNDELLGTLNGYLAHAVGPDAPTSA